MLSTLLSFFLFVASAYPQIPDGTNKGYHMLVGIPAAKRIRAREDAIHLEDTSRIYRGFSVSIDYFPFYGGLKIRLNNKRISVCGSSLVSSSRLVTAAHCWSDGFLKANETTVVLGSQFLFSGGLRIIAQEIIPHPDFNIRTFANDIAIIYLPYKINITRNIRPVALPLSEDLTNSFSGHWATAIGLGLTELDTGGKPDNDRELKFVDLKIISNDECAKNITDIRDTDLCTSGEGRVGHCEGDSGGPLITHSNLREILVGIIQSGGFKSQCGDGKPDAYTRVTSYIYFIESHVTLPTFTFKIEQQGNKQVERITVTE